MYHICANIQQNEQIRLIANRVLSRHHYIMECMLFTHSKGIICGAIYEWTRTFIIRKPKKKLNRSVSVLPHLIKCV